MHTHSHAHTYVHIHAHVHTHICIPPTCTHMQTTNLFKETVSGRYCLYISLLNVNHSQGFLSFLPFPKMFLRSLFDSHVDSTMPFWDMILLCSSGWIWTHDHPASIPLCPPVLGVQTFFTMSNLFRILMSNFVLHHNYLCVHFCFAPWTVGLPIPRHWG